MAKAFDIQRALQDGLTPEQISTYMTQNKLKPLQTLPKVEAKKKKSKGLLDLLSVGGSILGGGIGSLVAPGAGTIGGAAIGGGIGELIENLIHGEGADLKGVGKETVLSGVGGGIGLGVGRLLGGGAKTLAQSGIKGNLLKSTNLGVDQIDDIAGRAAGFSGSAYNKAGQATKNLANLGSQREEILRQSGGTISKKQLRSKVLSFFKDTDLWDPTDKPLQRNINNILTRIDKLPGTEVNSNSVNALKVSLNKLTSKAWKAYERGDVSSLNTRQRAALGIQKALDDILPSTVKPEARGALSNLNRSMADQYPLREGFRDQAAAGVNIPIPFFGKLNAGPLSGAIQGAQDLGVRTATRTANSKTLQGLVGQASARAFAPSTYQQEPQQPMDQGMGQPDIQSLLAQASGTQADTGLPSNNTAMGGQDIGEKLKMAALLDLMAGGKNTTKLLALAKAYEKPKMGEAQAAQISQIQAATGLVDQLETSFLKAQAAGQTGFLTGPLSGLAGKVSGGAVGREAALYNKLRAGFTALIARATGERGVLTDADAARALQLIASLNENPELAAETFNQLRTVFAQAEQRLSIPRGTTEDTSTDMLSLLGEE